MEEELIKRILPHSDDAERSVIGCMMMNREAIMIASEILTGDEFYRQQMGIVFDSMVELYNEGKPVDFVTLPEKLKCSAGDQQYGICKRSSDGGTYFS